MILVIASIGTARTAPGTPHIQYQKINQKITEDQGQDNKDRICAILRPRPC